MIWTPVMDANLKEMWNAGECVKLIAERLGFELKNAVISRARRKAKSLGLIMPHPGARIRLDLTEKRTATRKRRAATRNKPRPADDHPWRKSSARSRPAAKRKDPATLPEALAKALRDEPPLIISIFDIKEKHCRWPVGDPRDEKFGHCGRSATKGRYCAAHAWMAVQHT